MTDDEVYSLGVHYYDEDDIEVGKAVNCGVIVNHRVELSPEEQAEARENALKAYQNEELRKIQQRNSKPKPTPKAVRQEPEQPTLFDLGLMRAKTRLQHKVVTANGRLLPQTKKQELWAFRQCISHYAYRTKNGGTTLYGLRLSMERE